LLQEYVCKRYGCQVISAPDPTDPADHGEGGPGTIFSHYGARRITSSTWSSKPQST